MGRLNLYRAGGWSRIGMSWSTDFSELHGWYVNLQMPLAPSRFGFDSMDLVLDARVTPSGEWSWEDEDDFAEALDCGIFDRTIERAIRRHGEAVATLLADGRPRSILGGSTGGRRLPSVTSSWSREHCLRS